MFFARYLIFTMSTGIGGVGGEPSQKSSKRLQLGCFGVIPCSIHKMVRFQVRDVMVKVKATTRFWLDDSLEGGITTVTPHKKGGSHKLLYHWCSRILAGFYPQVETYCCYHV